MWFSALAMDPTNHLRLIAATHNGCSGAWALQCIAETRDAGLTPWTLSITVPVSASEGEGVVIIDDQTILFATNESGLFLSRNDGATWQMVADGASGSSFGSPPTRGQDGAYYLPSAYGVLSSTDLTNWTSVFGGIYFQLAGTGQHLVASSYFQDQFYVAALSAPTVWTQASVVDDGLPTGAPFIAYEPQHHVVYSSNWTRFRRVVMQ